MLILGFNKTTLLDYPEHVACTIFTGGCNFRCPFCHNGDLVIAPDSYNAISEEEIMSHLQKRKNILQGVCITGGEPLLQPDLVNFIKKVKALGLKVKLDTNGSMPEKLENILESGLVDYVAMDVKASKTNYTRAVGVSDIDIANIEKSVDLLKKSTVDYEFRTTIVKGIHKTEEFELIGEWLKGAPRWFLQCYKDSENVIEHGFEAFSKDELKKIEEIAKKYVPNAALRGVE